MPDWSTLRPTPNEDGVAAVICDVQSKTGEPCNSMGGPRYDERVYDWRKPASRRSSASNWSSTSTRSTITPRRHCGSSTPPVCDPWAAPGKPSAFIGGRIMASSWPNSIRPWRPTASRSKRSPPTRVRNARGGPVAGTPAASRGQRSTIQAGLQGRCAATRHARELRRQTQHAARRRGGAPAPELASQRAQRLLSRGRAKARVCRRPSSITSAGWWPRW